MGTMQAKKASRNIQTQSSFDRGLSGEEILPTPLSTESNRRNADKAQLRAEVLAMNTWGMSQDEIGVALRTIRRTRVGQIVKPK